VKIPAPLGTIQIVTWGFLWLMLALKIPLISLIVIVWWAIKKRPQEPPAAEDGGGGGSKLPHPHTPQPFRRPPRRGPHGGAPPASPARVRTVRARARTLEH
jgi:hypothetical protein